MEFLRKLKYILLNKSSLTFPLLFILLTARASDLPRFSTFKDKKCNIENNYIFLTDEIKNNFEKNNDIAISSKIIKRLNVNCNGKKSKAYILNDRVRTHYQTLLIWIQDSKVSAIETVYFKEPKQYKAPELWTKSIKERSIKDIYKVDALSGATLTRQSTLKLVKKSLLYEQL